jgi:alkanesulfonate monooxygenase
VAEKINQMREVAAKEGTELKFGIRLHIVPRESSEEAWAAAKELARFVEPETIEQAQAELAKSESEGECRMVDLHKGSTEGLEVSPNLWAGVGLVTGGVGTALVDSPDEVAERLLEFQKASIDTFILFGYPHLEECYRVAELLFPKPPVKPERNPLSNTFVPGGWQGYRMPFLALLCHRLIRRYAYASSCSSQKRRNAFIKWLRYLSRCMTM